jgi:hypothetical protein
VDELVIRGYYAVVVSALGLLIREHGHPIA